MLHNGWAGEEDMIKGCFQGSEELAKKAVNQC